MAAEEVRPGGYFLEDARIRRFTLGRFRHEAVVELQLTYDLEKNWATDKDVIVLTFELVQEMRIVNGINDFMIENPDAVDEGVDQIDALEVVDAEAILARYATSPLPMHHFSIAWGGSVTAGRQIDIVCAGLRARLPSGEIIRLFGT